MLTTTTQPADPQNTIDKRPRFAIGHVPLSVSDVGRATEFYTKLGMRLIVNMGQAAILELRGGTHIILQTAQDAAPESLDLIVDDIDETHALFERLGGKPTSIRRGNPHDRFAATDTEGNHLTINSNHAMGIV